MQKGKNKINVSYTNTFENLEVKNSKTGKTQIIKNIEASITGKDSHLETNDYNFDGFTDFASFIPMTGWEFIPFIRFLFSIQNRNNLIS